MTLSCQSLWLHMTHTFHTFHAPDTDASPQDLGVRELEAYDVFDKQVLPLLADPPTGLRNPPSPSELIGALAFPLASGLLTAPSVAAGPPARGASGFGTQMPSQAQQDLLAQLQACPIALITSRGVQRLSHGALAPAVPSGAAAAAAALSGGRGPPGEVAGDGATGPAADSAAANTVAVVGSGALFLPVGLGGAVDMQKAFPSYAGSLAVVSEAYAGAGGVPAASWSWLLRCVGIRV